MKLKKLQMLELEKADYKDVEELKDRFECENLDVEDFMQLRKEYKDHHKDFVFFRNQMDSKFKQFKNM
jgi:hypothetical protein